MERVVITGMGINSCIGNTLETVTEFLKAGRSGIRYNEVYAKLPKWILKILIQN